MPTDAFDTATDAPPVILYLHIPKAGGTTLSSWMFEEVKTDTPRDEASRLLAGVFYYPAGFVVEPTDEELALARRILPRDDLRAVFGHFHFGVHRHLTRPSTYVTVLREPVDRIVSLYSFQRLVDRNHGSHHGVRLPDHVDLEAFVTHPPYPEIDNGQTRRLAGTSPAIGQCTNAMIETAKRHLREAVAVVGTTDRFDETIILLCRTFGWSADKLYYPANVNTARENKPLPDPLRQHIEQTQALDLALYRYACELMDEQIARAGPGFADDLADFKARKQAWYDQVGGWDMPSHLR